MALPKDHGGAIEVQRPRGVAVIIQRFARAGDGPFLRVVHGIDYAGWDGQAPLERIPFVLAHPAADFGVSLIRCAPIGIIVKRRIPTVGRNLADAVTALLHVFPKSRCVRSIGQNSSHSHNRYGSISGIFHDDRSCSYS